MILWTVGLFGALAVFTLGYGMGRDRGFEDGRASRPKRPVLRESPGEPPIVEWV